MKKLLGSVALALLVTSSAFAVAGSRMVCEKTGTIVEQCCCVEKDGALVCALTGETVPSCCCTPAR